MKKEVEQRVFKDSIKLYNNIAEQYSETPGRNKPRQFIKEELASAAGSVLDVGCGNGITVEELPELVSYTGIDASEQMVYVAKKKYPSKQFLHYDGIHIPFEKNSFDVVVSFAVLHHIPGSLRREVVKEMKRVLKPGGTIVVSVWNLWDVHFMKYFFQNYWKTATRINELNWNDLLYPWHRQDGTFVGMRYFHMFRRKELRKLFKKEGFIDIEVGDIKFSNTKFRNFLLKAKK